MERPELDRWLLDSAEVLSEEENRLETLKTALDINSIQDSLADDVELGLLTIEEANILLNNWREQYGA